MLGDTLRLALTCRRGDRSDEGSLDGGHHEPLWLAFTLKHLHSSAAQTTERAESIVLCGTMRSPQSHLLLCTLRCFWWVNEQERIFDAHDDVPGSSVTSGRGRATSASGRVLVWRSVGRRDVDECGRGPADEAAHSMALSAGRRGAGQAAVSVCIAPLAADAVARIASILVGVFGTGLLA